MKTAESSPKNGVKLFSPNTCRESTCYRNGQFIFTIRHRESANRQRHIVSNQCMDRKMFPMFKPAICHETRLRQFLPVCLSPKLNGTNLSALEKDRKL
ncbi:hypothetical protein AVEN_146827-1 [Araneus ventricosus]|uniref:Uncharacterized protein n=1 Tax=Araneus ventricosus TaxID=182803 RepID=A0A4Y1ZX67_ARAVE|nr:hypothetical protein AVEN_146827-1 [Araneus ventricosus]